MIRNFFEYLVSSGKLKLKDGRFEQDDTKVEYSDISMLLKATDDNLRSFQVLPAYLPQAGVQI